MIIQTENESFAVDIDTLSQTANEAVDSMGDLVVKLPTGEVIDFSRKSLLSIALRQVTILLLVPMLNYIAFITNTQLPKKEKHADPIQYALRSSLFIVTQFLKDKTYRLDISDVNGIHTIIGVNQVHELTQNGQNSISRSL